MDTAYEIIKKFDKMYLKESTALQIICRSSLENIKLQNYKDVTSFFDAFEKAVNDLKASGARVSEQEKLNYMIKALPRSYSHIGDLIDVLPENEKTVEYLKGKIKIKAMEGNNEGETSEEITSKTHAFAAIGSTSTGRKYPIKWFNCGRIGHVKNQCRLGNMNNEYQRGGQYPRVEVDSRLVEDVSMEIETIITKGHDGIEMGLREIPKKEIVLVQYQN